MGCYCYPRNIQVRLSDGKTPFERRFEEPFKGPIIPFGSLVVENHPISTKDQSWIHQFGKQVLLGIFFGYVLYAGRIWKGDIPVVDLEELEEMDASETHAKRLNAKEAKMPDSGEMFIFSVPDGTVKPFWRRPGTENIHLGTGFIQFEERITKISIENQKGSPLPLHFQDSFPDAAEARDDFWSISGDFKNRHHVEPRVKLLYGKRRIISYFTELHWRHQSYPHNLGCNAGKAASMIIGTSMDQEICLLHGEVDERNGKQHQGLIILWPEIWRSMLRKSKMKEKQNWASEKPKLENARRQRNVFHWTWG